MATTAMMVACTCVRCDIQYSAKFSDRDATKLLCRDCWNHMMRWYTTLRANISIVRTNGFKELGFQPDHVHAWVTYDKAMEEKHVREESRREGGSQRWTVITGG